MLDLAIKHTNVLQERFVEIAFQDHFKFYRTGTAIDYCLPIYNNSRDGLQFVSIAEGDRHLMGYFGCRIDRETNTAFDLQIINFEDRNEAFSADRKAFFRSLFEQYGAQRVVWCVIVGNPAEKLHDASVARLGGRIVGTFTRDTKLYDGQLYDIKWYEVLKEHYDAWKAGVQ